METYTEWAKETMFLNNKLRDLAKEVDKIQMEMIEMHQKSILSAISILAFINKRNIGRF